MCGRYAYFPREFSDLRLTWNVDEVFGLYLKPRYNIAPTQEAPVIVQSARKRTLKLFRWGLIPWWAKDPAIGNTMINARAETLAEKPAFKNLLGKRRCRPRRARVRGVFTGWSSPGWSLTIACPQSDMVRCLFRN
jgi:putative SOS response-associated peptidase YedK